MSAEFTIKKPVEENLKSSSPTHSHKKRVIILSGPTGSGKTDLSIRLAEALDGEIISADSMQVYRKMDIGTAKASLEQRVQVPHHMIDVCHITSSFNVVDYFYQARKCCEMILERKKVPIVVGGAGFYLRNFIYGPPQGPSSNPQLRERIEKEAQTKGVEVLFNRIKEKDPLYAQSITCHDRQKIIRAVEIMEITGKKVSSLFWKLENKQLDYDFRCWFIYRPREELYKIIEKRCELMLEQGFLEETEALLKEGLTENHSASLSIGYRHTIDYLNGSRTTEDYEEFVRQFKIASRRYAKKQFTWFRKETLFRWLNISLYDPETILDMLCQDYFSLS